MTIKMKKQSPQISCNETNKINKPESPPKVIKKHECSEHTRNRSDADERPKIVKKSSQKLAKNFCPCNPCSCDKCPDILQLLSKPLISDKGIGNKSKGFEGVEDLSLGCPASYSRTCCDEVERPKPIPMDLITYDDECTCELIARAIRADVHRYLRLVDRAPKPEPAQSTFKSCPICNADSIPKSMAEPSPDLNPDCMAESSPDCMAESSPDCMAESISKCKS